MRPAQSPQTWCQRLRGMQREHIIGEPSVGEKLMGWVSPSPTRLHDSMCDGVGRSFVCLRHACWGGQQVARMRAGRMSCKVNVQCVCIAGSQGAAARTRVQLQPVRVKRPPSSVTRQEWCGRAAWPSSSGPERHMPEPL